MKATFYNEVAADMIMWPGRLAKSILIKPSYLNKVLQINTSWLQTHLPVIILDFIQDKITKL